MNLNIIAILKIEITMTKMHVKDRTILLKIIESPGTMRRS